jgi:enediyne biosynthesis protein E4
LGDYNNDGWEDLFLTYYGQNRLYRNNGDGTFTNVTAEARLLHPKTRYSTGCTFVDYNRDGHLDLFVSNYLEIDLATAPKPSLDVPNCNYAGVAVLCGPRGLPEGAAIPLPQQRRRHLYRCFRGVGRRRPARIVLPDGGELRRRRGRLARHLRGLRHDTFVLLMNNRNGTFREEALLRGVAVSGEGREMGGMGAGLGDYNLDGHTDIVKTHYYTTRPPASTATTAKATSTM